MRTKKLPGVVHGPKGSSAPGLSRDMRSFEPRPRGLRRNDKEQLAGTLWAPCKHLVGSGLPGAGHS